MKKTLTIKEVEVFRQGTSDNGKPWKLYKVKVNNSEIGEFTTFEDMYENIVGETVEINLEKNEKYNSWQQLNEKKAMQNDKHEELLSAMRKIFIKLEAIHDAVKNTASK